jgi:hypothetical protein
LIEYKRSVFIDVSLGFVSCDKHAAFLFGDSS